MTSNTNQQTRETYYTIVFVYYVEEIILMSNSEKLFTNIIFLLRVFMNMPENNNQ